MTLGPGISLGSSPASLELGLIRTPERPSGFVTLMSALSLETDHLAGATKVMSQRATSLSPTPPIGCAGPPY